MPNYIVYLEATGEIQRTGCCPQEAIPAQAVYSGEVAMEGTANDATEKVVAGKVVAK